MKQRIFTTALFGISFGMSVKAQERSQLVIDEALYKSQINTTQPAQQSQPIQQTQPTPAPQKKEPMEIPKKEPIAIPIKEPIAVPQRGSNPGKI